MRMYLLCFGVFLAGCGGGFGAVDKDWAYQNCKAQHDHHFSPTWEHFCRSNDAGIEIPPYVDQEHLVQYVLEYKRKEAAAWRALSNELGGGTSRQTTCTHLSMSSWCTTR